MSEALPKRSGDKLWQMPQDPLCTSSHLSLQWEKQSEKQAPGKARIRVPLIVKTMITHTARLISIHEAHSLLKFKSANSGLHCLCPAAYTWHQIYPLGMHYCLQETSTHPFQNRPHSIVLFPGLCRGILCHIIS